MPRSVSPPLPRRASIAGATVSACWLLAASARGEVCVFSSGSALSIAPQTAGRTITASELSGNAGDVEVRLYDLAASEFAGYGVEDFDLLLVAPTGQKIVLMSNACAAEFGPIDLVFSNGASGAIPTAGGPHPTACANGGVYKPGDYSGGTYGLESPAPAPPYTTNLGSLVGLSPIGAWTLYAAAASNGDSGSLASFELRITAAACSGGPPATWPLSVTVTGGGTGSVTSSSAGIDCPGDCGETYDDQSIVTLTAHPVSPSTFAGWSGDCSGGATDCQVTMSAARSVTATFAPPPPRELTVGLFGDGEGVVSSAPAGILCPSDCVESFPYGGVVELTATASSGSIFAGWTDASCGLATTCQVTMTMDLYLQARFDLSAGPPEKIYADDFETGSACGWSGQVGLVPACGG